MPAEVRRPVTTDCQLQRESIQKREPTGKTRETARQNEHANSDDQCAAENFNGMEMFFEASVEGKEMFKSDACEKKRNAKTSGVDGQQEHALRHGFLGAGDRHDGGQNRADARRPTKSEGQSQNQGSDESSRF